MITLLRLIGMALLLWLISVTGSKLFKMAQIRGFVEGPTPVVKTITGKAISGGHSRNSYVLSWDGADPKVSGPDRINLPQEIGETLQPGDPIDILYFPGDPMPHHRLGFFANNGNFGFDFFLLLAWVSGLVALSSTPLRQLQRRWRAART